MPVGAGAIRRHRCRRASDASKPLSPVAPTLVLYLIFILMPLAGYLNAAAAGHAVNFFGIVSIPPLLPENGRLSQVAIAIHLVGQYPLYLFVGFTSPVHCSTAPSDATGSSNGCCRYAASASRLLFPPG